MNHYDKQEVKSPCKLKEL